jgi:predicted phage terminase large subunit-like protein
VHLETKPAVADKFVRAQPTAAAWNQGKILLPAEAPAWVDPLLAEVHGFTGVRDRRDDQVDAMVAAHDALVTTVAAPSAFDKFRSRLPHLRS